MLMTTNCILPALLELGLKNYVAATMKIKCIKNFPNNLSMIIFFSTKYLQSIGLCR